jgi:hypothetical protein
MVIRDSDNGTSANSLSWNIKFPFIVTRFGRSSSKFWPWSFRKASVYHHAINSLNYRRFLRWISPQEESSQPASLIRVGIRFPRSPWGNLCALKCKMFEREQIVPIRSVCGITPTLCKSLKISIYNEKQKQVCSAGYA